SHQGENRDVFALYREEQLVALSVLEVRNGRIAENSNFSFSDVRVNDEEVLSSAISQFYEGGRPIPEEIILPVPLEDTDLLQSMLVEKRGERLEILAPKRGIRARLLGLAALNARQHFLAVFNAEERYLD